MNTCTFAKVTATTVRNLAVNFGVKYIVQLKKKEGGREGYPSNRMTLHPITDVYT